MGQYGVSRMRRFVDLIPMLHVSTFNSTTLLVLSGIVLVMLWLVSRKLWHSWRRYQAKQRALRVAQRIRERHLQTWYSQRQRHYWRGK